MENKNEFEIVITPKEFGLELVQAEPIEAAFAPKIAEREALIGTYESIMTQELSVELCVEAKELRLKLVKVRTGIAGVHTTQKAFFLAAGKFVDAWKNKETLPVTQMEEKLKGIENHFENIEKERIETLRTDRLAQLMKYMEEEPTTAGLLGELPELAFEDMLLGAKTRFEAEQKRKEEEEKAEKKRIEEDNSHAKRKVFLLDVWVFLIEAQKEIHFGKISEEEFQLILNDARESKKDHDKKQLEIQAENDRLKKEAEEKAVKDKYRGDKLRPYIIYIRDYDKIFSLPDAEFEAELVSLNQQAMEQIKFDAKKTEEAEKERFANEKKLADEKKKSDILAKKVAAQEKIDQEKADKIEADRKKGDAVKIKDLISDLESLKSKYEFKSMANRSRYKQVGQLIDKVVNHINK